jgi:4-diphosphocytidyl-2-C-methyl-D-erythritol kinase
MNPAVNAGGGAAGNAAGPVRRPPIAWGQALPAPAKLNLFLHVLGRRADGYHCLQTLFRFIDRADWIRIEPEPGGQIRLATPFAGLADADNLVIRAARRLRERAASPGLGARIAIEKTIPMGGGLGGGSSDAATTLIGLNALWGTGLDTEALAAIGLELGADVPVFIRGFNAFGEGVGEALTPVDLPPAVYLVLVPQVSIPTREIFGDPALTRDTQPIKIAAFFAGLPVSNDLEPVVRRRYPVVAEHLDWLSRFAPARMSGSGACVFAQFGERDEAMAVFARRPSGMQGFIAAGLERHPLMLSG